MTNTSHQKKESTLRIVAISGLVAIVILIAWLSIQIVKVAPSAFSSLASLAEGLTQYEEDAGSDMADTPLSPILSATEVPAGETTAIEIGAADQLGTFTFAYGCVEGISLFALSEDGGRELTCNTTYNLDESTVTIQVETMNEVDTTVPYTVGFLRPTDKEAFRTGEGTFIAKAVEEMVEEESVTETEGQVAGESTSEENSEETEVVVTTPTPEPEETVRYVYQIPNSNPNGFVDLATKFVGVGSEDGLSSTLERNETGVFFFEVKNIGTKTSDDWRFTAALPGGQTFTSDRQLPLKPNERATLAITVNTDSDASHTFTVRVTTDDDRSSSNNSFSQRVTITR